LPWKIEKTRCPDAGVGGVEEVCAVLVHLDTGLRLRLAVRVAAYVVPAIEDQYLETEVVRASLGDREPEQTRTDDDEIDVHKLSCFSKPG
jgi:hypothetical protein